MIHIFLPFTAATRIRTSISQINQEGEVIPYVPVLGSEQIYKYVGCKNFDLWYQKAAFFSQRVTTSSSTSRWPAR